MIDSNNSFYYWLSNLANIAGLASFEMNAKQISNDELLKYLEHQDQDYLKTVVEQNIEIINQNEEIISLLKSDKRRSINVHKYYIDKIINSGNSYKMKQLEEIMIDTISYMKDLDKDEYMDIECDLYEIAEGKILTEEKAKHIITKMKPYGMHWTLDETEQVRKSKGYSMIRPVDFWIVMNGAYNDFHKLFDEDVDMYAKYSKEFIIDEDAEECKVYDYFTKIPKKN